MVRFGEFIEIRNTKKRFFLNIKWIFRLSKFGYKKLIIFLNNNKKKLNKNMLKNRKALIFPTAIGMSAFKLWNLRCFCNAESIESSFKRGIHWIANSLFERLFKPVQLSNVRKKLFFNKQVRAEFRNSERFFFDTKLNIKNSESGEQVTYRRL